MSYLVSLLTAATTATNDHGSDDDDYGYGEDEFEMMVKSSHPFIAWH
jgi:hypothetical protein